MTASLIKVTTRTRYAKNHAGKPIKPKIGDRTGSQRARIVALATIRRRELDRLFTDKFGRFLPDSEAGRIAAKIMLDHIAYSRAEDRQWLMNDWLDVRSPCITGEECAEMIRAVFRHPIRYNADTLAERLGVTNAPETARIENHRRNRHVRRGEEAAARRDAAAAKAAQSVTRGCGKLPRVEDV